MIDTIKQLRWKLVTSSQNISVPSPRWGHASSIIQNQFVIFGGYADTFYKGDLWAYNSQSRQWKEIQTSGRAPTCRSNCSMNYDSQNNRLVLFGGSGPSKRKYNSIHVLDWSTKVWEWVQPQGQNAPEQRTYHTAELIGSYLLVFGGQTFTDLNDVWIFDFKSKRWSQVTFDSASLMPTGRRFHTSTLYRNQIIIIGGCFGSYRPLNEVWGLDLTNLIENGNMEGLRWKQYKLEGAAFLTRWGHSTSLMNNKIYVFGGRFTSDLNDLMQIDLQALVVKSVKKIVDLPSARRRPCCAFMGRSLLMFGGFNGEYYNDLYYLTFPQQLANKISFKVESKTIDVKPSKETYSESVECNQPLNILKDNKYISKSPIVYISDKEFEDIMKHSSGDVLITMKDNSSIRIQSALLSLNSIYFKHLFQEDFASCSNNIKFLNNSPAVCKVFLKYLEYSVLFIPEFFQKQNWFELILISQFYHLTRLIQICEQQFISNQNYDCSTDMLKFAIDNKLERLQSHCAEMLVRHQCSILISNAAPLKYNSYKDIQNRHFEGANKNDKKVFKLKRKIYEELFFDIQQDIFHEQMMFSRGLKHTLSLQQQMLKPLKAKGKENQREQRY